jgi:ribosomal protein S18 acetylase RimI-like enzyme
MTDISEGRKRRKRQDNQDMLIKPYIPEYEKAVIELWERCALTKSWNNPKLDIERKLRVNPEMFLVGIIDSKVAATVMGGYEGHRGWVNYLAVDPEYRRQGLGRQMMEAVEKKLLEKGCPKINLQIRTGNTAAVNFYDSIGYKTDDVVSMGKRLVAD